MINGRAMLSCPASAVTSSVARDATDSDSQRLRRGDADSSCGKVIGGGSTFKINAVVCLCVLYTLKFER
jgi:hypothetical protein